MQFDLGVWFKLTIRTDLAASFIWSSKPSFPVQKGGSPRSGLVIFGLNGKWVVKILDFLG